MTDFWVVRAGRGGRYTTEFEQTGRCAVGYFVEQPIDGMSRDDLTELVAAAMHEQGAPESGLVNSVGQLHRFANDIEVGDVVITPDSDTRELLWGRVTGPYVYDEEVGEQFGGFPHQLPVDWQGRRSRDDLPQRVLYSLGSSLTVFQPKGSAHLEAFIAGDLVPQGPTAGNEDAVVDDTDLDAEGTDLLADLESRAEELIARRMAFLDGYETQAIVAGVLRAMGYHTSEAPEGADGGVDVVASRDPLAVEPPIIKVQVKAQPNSKASPDLVRQLAGVLGDGDRGVFVSTGGFTRAARSDAQFSSVTLIDLPRLRELYVDYYDKLDQDTRSLLPLRRLLFPVGD